MRLSFCTGSDHIVSVNSPDIAYNDIAGEKDGVQQRKYSALLELACASKDSCAHALMQLKSEIEAIGIAYNSFV